MKTRTSDKGLSNMKDSSLPYDKPSDETLESIHVETAGKTDKLFVSKMKKWFIFSDWHKFKC